MSDTRNVKLGVCKVTFGGIDLGYTKGGVDVDVKTETHKVQVDQFGQSVVNEYIMGRTITVKCPLAETTIVNLNAIMPGSVLTQTVGTTAAGKITVATVPTVGDSLLVGGTPYKFVSVATSNTADVVIGATAALTATALQLAMAASTDLRMKQIGTQAPLVGTPTVIPVLYGVPGTFGNQFKMIASNPASITITNLTGGLNSTQRADVGVAVGISLLATAQLLNLHPTANAANDFSDDLTIPLANTPGQVQFAYKFDAERVFVVDFQGYPDPVTQSLFFVGDPDAGL